MTPPTATLNIIDRTKQMATATAAAMVLLFATEDMLPSQYYPLNPPFFSGYQWEVEKDYGEGLERAYEAREEFQIIQEFVTRLITRSKDLEPRFDRLISENFWELV